MTDDYEPELGQMIFGNRWKPLSVPVEVESALRSLAEAFDTLHPSLDNPFSNTAARYKWSCFEAHAYDWGDEEQPFNFKWRDFEIGWYKYLGRGMSSNRKISAAELAEMLRECMAALMGEDPVDCYV